MKFSQTHWIKEVSDVFESMSHGTTLTKFIAIDKGVDEGDFTVEIHGFVTEDGKLVITNEKVEPTPVVGRQNHRRNP